MHYMNGRGANNGDKIVHISPYNKRVTMGILYDAQAGNDFCNGQCAPFGGGPHFCPNLKECVHADDFMAALPTEFPDTSDVGELA
jgi:hypothetical protein